MLFEHYWVLTKVVLEIWIILLNFFLQSPGIIACFPEKFPSVLIPGEIARFPEQFWLCPKTAFVRVVTPRYQSS